MLACFKRASMACGFPPGKPGAPFNIWPRWEFSLSLLGSPFGRHSPPDKSGEPKAASGFPLSRE